MNPANAPSLFVEVFLCKLEEVEYSNSILLIKCHKEQQIALVMFNLFAKNMRNITVICIKNAKYGCGI